jgi:Relaxase/Mobilisation nuclease domain
MIPRIHKHKASVPLVSYLLRPTKEAQIIESSVFTSAINESIASEAVILDPAVRSTVSAELNQAFTRINNLNPRLENNMMHLIIGFDPQDGELSAEFKGQIATDIMDQMGFGETYWVAVNHGRDDPEHDHVHNHDHMHILAARVDRKGKTISDSWDFPRVSTILRNIEQHYELTPFVPFWEREYVTPEIRWMLQPHPEEEVLQQQVKSRLSR